MSNHKQKVGVFNINADQFNQRKQKEAFEARKAAAASLGAEIEDTQEIKAPTAAEQQKNRERTQTIDAMYPFTNEYIPLQKLRPAKPEWNFFPAQNVQMLSDLVGNIAMYGQTTPARVWKQTDGTYIILGGHTRFAAISKLHELYQSGEVELEHDFDTMWCSVYDVDTLDDVEARKIIIYDNTIRRNNTKSLMARSIINMNQLMAQSRSSRRPDTNRGRVREQIAATLGISEGTVSGIYKLRKLIPEFWPRLDDLDRQGRITDSFAQAVAVLPEDLQHYIFDKALWVDNKLNASQLKRLSKAENREAVDHVFGAPVSYAVTAKAELTEALPEGYKTMLFTGTPEEIEMLRHAVYNIIKDNNDISEKTKQINNILLENK